MGSADKEMTVTEVLNFLHDVIRLQKTASLDGQVSPTLQLVLSKSVRMNKSK